MQNFEIGFASTKLGESFNSKSANNSRFVRSINCRAFFPLTTKAVLAESKLEASRNRFVFNAPQSPLSMLMIKTSSFSSGRTARSGWNLGSVRFCNETKTLFINAAYGRPSSACCCALRILEAATICIALVICAVLLIDLIRRRMSCVFAIPNYRLQTMDCGIGSSDLIAKPF